jgi:C-terminal processing protease CtpA/Prc
MEFRSITLVLKRPLVSALCAGAVAFSFVGPTLAQDRVDEVTQSAAEIQGSESYGQPYERDSSQGQTGRQTGQQFEYFEEGQEFNQQSDQQDRTFRDDAYQDQFDRQFSQQQGGGSERRGGLGVVLRETEGQGVRIVDVYQNSPAEQAGLLAGDQVVEINGQTVRSVQELQSRIARRDPGTEVEIVGLRNGREQTFNARLESRQEALSQQGRSQQYQQTYQQRWSQGQQRQIQTRLASVERQLQQLLSEVRSLRSQVGGTSDVPRQAQRYESSFEQQRTQDGREPGQRSDEFYYEQQQRRQGQTQGQGSDRFEF